MLRISEVEQITGYRVKLRLTDGQVVERDLADLLVGDAFEPLRANADSFAQISVQDGTLVWPNGIDLCPDMIIWGGPPPVLVDAKAS